MNASSRGSGSSVRNVPPPIATMCPVTAGQDRLTGGAGHGRHLFHREGAFRTCHTSPAPPPRWQSSRWRHAGRRARGEEAEAHHDGAHGHGAADERRRRTSAASAARASRRRRSARAAPAGRPSSGSARHDLLRRRHAHRRSRSCARRRRRSRFRPAPRPATPTADARRRSRRRRSRSGSRCCTTTTASPSTSIGDSIANYGGITRFKTVLDRLRADADAARRDASTEARARVTISSGDNFLAGLNLRASFQRFDAGLGPFYDSDAIAQLGYDAVTIGNHEYDFGPPASRSSSPSSAAASRSCRPTPTSAASRCCRRCATTAGSPTRPWSSATAS